MSSPLISVIVPIYKAEKYLDRCVDSIVNQTYKNIEIILVDDGSPDNCPQICDIWAKKDNRIKVIHKKNAGAPAARNTGIKASNGDVVAFVDADDWIETAMYSVMIKCLLQDNSDIVICGSNWILDDGRIIKTEANYSCILDGEKGLDRLLDNTIKEQVWDKIYTKKVIDGLLFVEGKKIDDIFWTYRVLGNANRISLIDCVFYNYFQNSESIMGQGYKSYWIDALDAYKFRCEYIKKRFPVLYDKALFVYMGSCHYHLQFALRTNQSKEVIDNILGRWDYRKAGHPTRGISLKQRIWFYLFTYFPKTTCRLRNITGTGL